MFSVKEYMSISRGICFDLDKITDVRHWYATRIRRTVSAGRATLKRIGRPRNDRREGPFKGAQCEGESAIGFLLLGYVHFVPASSKHEADVLVSAAATISVSIQ